MPAALAPTVRAVPHKRWLQAAVALAACVPVAAGLQGILQGVSRLDPAGSATLDSHYRYLSGLLLGLGLTFWSLTPHIEKHGVPVRALTLLVVIGGAGRAISLFEVGLPDTTMRLALIMELVVTPALCLWQMRIARQMDDPHPQR